MLQTNDLMSPFPEHAKGIVVPLESAGRGAEYSPA